MPNASPRGVCGLLAADPLGGRSGAEFHRVGGTIVATVKVRGENTSDWFLFWNRRILGWSPT